jgi:hypothetical protein
MVDRWPSPEKAHRDCRANEENLRQVCLRKADIGCVIALPHWSDYGADPNWWQLEYAQGGGGAADLVVGNHAHVVQAMQASTECRCFMLKRPGIRPDLVRDTTVGHRLVTSKGSATWGTS